MNREEEIKRWQASIDDDLLEEAQRPLPRGSAALRWGGLAACLCAAALALEQADFRRVLNGFLRKLTRQSRTYFIRRYWYGESIREIADSCGAGLPGCSRTYPAPPGG